MRICLLSYRSNPHCGGQGVYVRNIARELVKLGHAVDVVSGPPYPHLDPGASLVRLPGLDLYNPDDLFRKPAIAELANPLNLFEWLSVSTMGFPEALTFGFRALDYIRAHPKRYDIIHDNQSLSYGIYTISRMVPTIATIHHPITVDRDIAVKTAKGFFRKLKEMRWYSFVGMQKRVARRIKNIITVSKSAKEDIIREFGIKNATFHIAANGVDTDRFRPIPSIKREPGRIIVTNSADTPLKGLYYLLKATAEVSRKKRVRLVVVGQPGEKSKTPQIIESLGIKDLVKFTGRIDHEAFAVEYARAQVAVIPSLYEGFGLPAAEAMACGVPVISTTAGALQEVVGPDGILVPPADVSALSSAIIDLMENPEMAIRLGSKGRKRVLENFTWEKAAQQTEEAYKKTINDHRGY